MKKLVFVFALLAFSAVQANAQTVVLDADTNKGDNVATIVGETYTVTPVSGAWNDDNNVSGCDGGGANCTEGFEFSYTVDASPFAFGGNKVLVTDKFSTEAAAFAAAQGTTFTALDTIAEVFLPCGGCSGAVGIITLEFVLQQILGTVTPDFSFSVNDLVQLSVDFSPGDSFFDAPPTFDLSSPMEQSPAQQAALTRLFNQLQPTSMAGEFEEPPGRELEPMAEDATYSPPLDVEVAAGAAEPGFDFSQYFTESFIPDPNETVLVNEQNRITFLINRSNEMREAAEAAGVSFSSFVDERVTIGRAYETGDVLRQLLDADDISTGFQQLSDQFLLQQYLNGALNFQNQSDMNDYIESVIPELAAIVVL